MGLAQKPVLAMAAPIRDAVGKIRAVLVGASLIGVDGFLHLPHPNVLSEGSGFLLVSTRDRLFVASSDEDFILRPTPPHGVNALHDKAMEGFRGGGITVNANGIEEISGIASVPATDWFVVARVPTAVVFASVMRAQRYVAGNGLVVIVGFIVVSLGSLLAIFRPLLKAAEHADRMSLGEIPLELLPVVRDDEVGHLTRSFNRLIGKLQSNQSALERAAHHDPLTGLPNRTLLADRLRQALAIANRSGHNIAVLYMDLDGFKPINDALGHAAGDEALKEVARRLGLLVREADTVARMGGDEFMIVMGELNYDIELARTAACGVASKCLDAFVLPLTLDGRECRLGVSIGVVVGNGKCPADQLLNAADAAMYQAKNAGGRRFVVA
jgi:diguanylate cyclase (GGDEF)-like protein